jgi:hypothetical protein
MADDIIVDKTQIIGTNRVIWKAWKFWETNGPSYHTITHFGGDTYGRMGTEYFECPPMPAETAKAARLTGRLDKRLYNGTVTREWYNDQYVNHKVAKTRAAHAAILNAMPKLAALNVTFDDNGTIGMEV